MEDKIVNQPLNLSKLKEMGEMMDKWVP